jgi:hypothetical protein
MSVSEGLTRASDKLAELSGRAKETEDHAAVARTQATADVERSANEARAAAEAQADKLREAANAAEAHVSASWNELQRSWREHVAKMRRDIDAKRAENRAEDAEADALFAIDYAYVTIERVEYAVLDPISARMEADELAVH